MRSLVITPYLVGLPSRQLERPRAPPQLNTPAQHPSSTRQPTSRPYMRHATICHMHMYMYTYAYLHRVSPPSGASPAAVPALGAATGLDPLFTSLDPALEASFLFGLLQTRALKALQALPTYHPYAAAPCVRRPVRRTALPGYPPYRRGYCGSSLRRRTCSREACFPPSSPPPLCPCPWCVP